MAREVAAARERLWRMLWKKTYTLLEAARLAESDETLAQAGLPRARMGINTDDPSRSLARS